VGVQRGEDPAVVVPRPADEVVVRGVAPVPAQPGDVGLEAAAGGHDRPGADHAVGGEQAGAPVARHDQVLDRGAVAGGDPHPLGGPVVGVDQRLPPAEKEAVGPAEVQRAGQRRLPLDPVGAHPARDGLGLPHRQLGQPLVARAGADAAQVPPQLGERVGPGGELVRLAVDAADVAGVPGVAAAHGRLRALHDQHPVGVPPRGERGGEPGVAAADDGDVPRAAGGEGSPGAHRAHRGSPPAAGWAGPVQAPAGTAGSGALVSATSVK